jgi:replicative DNA helicase
MAYSQELKDKIPPHNDVAEQATLGAMLLDAEAVPVAGQFLKPEDFYSTANGKIYKAIRSLYDKGGSKADIITVSSELRQQNELDSVGGEAYIASLTNVVPTSANIEHYSKLVQDCALRRALIHISAQISSMSYDISEESYSLLEKAQKLIFELTDRKRILTYRSTHETAPIVMDSIVRAAKHHKEFTGIPSGFEDLDRMTSGFQNSEMIILGARPSVGKTAIALNMAAHIAVKENRPVAFFTLEMSDELLVTRLISSEAQVDYHKIRTGFITARDQAQLRDATGKFYDAPFFTVDMPNMKLLELRTQARRIRSAQNIEIIFIDYLGLIGTDEFYNNRYEQVSDISRSLKSLARELNIPIVVLAQLGRAAEKERPSLASLRDSGAIEQDADVVMFLHRDRKDDAKPGEEIPDTIETELIVAKQRNGPIGNLKLSFKPKFTQFCSVPHSYN